MNTILFIQVYISSVAKIHKSRYNSRDKVDKVII